MKRPVVFRVTNNLGLGGVQRRLASVLPVLARDFEVHVVTYRRRGHFFDLLPEEGVATHHLPLPSKWSPRGLFALARLFARYGADVVHTHSLGGNVSGLTAALLARVPVRIGQVHLCDMHWYGRGLKRRKQIVQETLVHRLASKRVLFVSKQSRDHFQRHTNLPADMLQVLHNGVALPEPAPEARAATRAELGVADDHVLAGFVGRVARGKGVERFVELALEAAQADPGLRFVLVGGGELAPFKARVDEAGLCGHIVFAGEVSNVARYYAAMDLCVFTSDEGVEGMPGVVLEALFAGLPVLSTDIAPVREITRYCPRVRFLREGEPAARAVREALAQPEADLGPLRREFSVAAMAERTANLYRELLEGA